MMLKRIKQHSANTWGLIHKKLRYTEAVEKKVLLIKNNRGSYPKVFLGKGVLKICSKFTGEHPCRSAISIKLQRPFVNLGIGIGIGNRIGTGTDIINTIIHKAYGPQT